MQTKKEKGKAIWLALTPNKQNVRTMYIINAIKCNQMKINGNFYCTIL